MICVNQIKQGNRGSPSQKLRALNVLTVENLLSGVKNQPPAAKKDMTFSAVLATPAVHQNLMQ
ncbi:hypothetical protein BJP43_11010 (plasmid) [Candidatus Williamhamiltonella defendens]|uniref:Uncharacterized protein n=1 Tax=Candidatus Williamhamiltonella defendens TaxID=138072 RepID=A0A2D3TGH1_9ENTR|nr:hypothetical protein BJP43_11010 [Candidatus Hamiltonella defensa]